MYSKKNEKIYERIEAKCRRQSWMNYRRNKFDLPEDNNKKRNNTFKKINNKTINDFSKLNRNIKLISKKEINMNDTQFETDESKEEENNTIKENFLNFQDMSSFSFNFINNKKKKILNIKKESNDFRPIGFKNIGNSCYINSVLQILFRTPGFLKNLRECQNSPNYQPNILIEALIELSNGQKTISPLRIIKNKMSEIDYTYGQNVQKDSQKFGIDLIEQIIVSIKGETSSDDENDEKEEIGENIYFKFLNDSSKQMTSFEKMFLIHESYIKFGKDKMCKNGFENWLTINLTFPNNHNTYSIEDLLSMKYQKLDNIFLRENSKIIQEENKFFNYYDKLNFNSKCIDENENDNYNDIYQNHSFLEYIQFRFNQFCYMVKQYFRNLFSKENNNIKREYISFKQLASLPNILIISINRAILGQEFHYNKLKFSKYLNVNDYLDKVIFPNDSSSGLYKLYGVNECFSLEKNLGHYLSYVEKEEDIWLKFDDERIDIKTPNFKGNRYVVGLYYIKIK